MDCKLIFLMLFVISSFHAVFGNFTVEPGNSKVVVQGQEVAKLFFKVKPWPPPCSSCHPNRLELSVYYNVTVELWSSFNETVLLTSVQFTDGNMVPANASQLAKQQAIYDGGPISGGVQFNLSYPTLANQGTYRLVIRYGTNCSIAAEKALIVHAVPQTPNITTSFDGEPVDAGKSISLTCTAGEANPVATLRWTKAHEVIKSIEYLTWKVSSVYWTSSTIRLTTSSGDHGAVFVCSAWNDVNVDEPTSNSVSLLVRFVPEVIVDPCLHYDDQYYVIEGEDAHFRCSASAFPEVTLIRWYSADTNESNLSEVLGTQNQTDLVVRSVGRDAAARRIGCTADNKLGTSQLRSCQLNVQYGPKFTLPSVLELNENDNITVSCSVTDANPPVTEYKWQKHTSILSHNRDLVELKARREDAGNYTCSATNTLTPTNQQNIVYTSSSTVNILIMYRPVWRKFALKKFTLQKGIRATLLCKVDAYPNVTFTWSYRKQEISSNDNFRIVNLPYESSLEINKTSQDKIIKSKSQIHGTYKCMATNIKGSSMFEIETLVPGIPDMPQECSLYNVSSDSVTVSCMRGYNGGTNKMTFYIIVSLAGGKTVSVSHNVQWLDEETAVICIQTLLPNCKYRVAIYGENKFGRSDEYTELYFQTATSADGVNIDQNQPGESEPQMANIIGGVVGGIIGVVFLTAIAIIIYWRYEPRRHFDDDNEYDNDIMSNDDREHEGIQDNPVVDAPPDKNKPTSETPGDEIFEYIADMITEENNELVAVGSRQRPGVGTPRRDNCTHRGKQRVHTFHNSSFIESQDDRDCLCDDGHDTVELCLDNIPNGILMNGHQTITVTAENSLYSADEVCSIVLHPPPQCESLLDLMEV